MRIVLQRLWCLLAIVLVLAPRPARADNDTPQQIAEGHFKTGLKLFDQGNYEAARLAFLQAQAVYPRASLRRNLALCELKTNRPLEAIENLRAYLADPSTTPEKKEPAKKNLEEAFARTGHYAVRANDGATVFVDGKARPALAPFKEPLDVLAGKHLIEARLGERSAKKEVDAPLGTVVDVDLRFEEKASTAVVPPVAPASSGAQDGVVAPPAEPAPSFWTARRTAGVIVVGVGVALVATGFYFNAQRGSEADRAASISGTIGSNSACATGADPRCKELDEAYDAQDRNATLRNVTFGVGITGAVAGVVMLAWPSTRSTSSTGLRPIVGPNVAGLQLQGVLP